MVKNKRKDKEQNKFINDEQDNLITNENEIKSTWKRYFDTLLNVVHDDEEITEGEEEPVTVNHTDEDLTLNDIEYVWKY